eukprot:SM000284S10669  [mRNA]  locus=s284:131173:132093:- [translate_table: standard]
MAAQLGAGGLFASTAPPALENAGIEDSAIGSDAVKSRYPPSHALSFGRFGAPNSAQAQVTAATCVGHGGIERENAPPEEDSGGLFCSQEAFYSAADKVYSAAAAAGSTLGVTDGDEDDDRREPDRGTPAAGLGSGGCVEDPGPSNGEWHGECGVAGAVGPSDAGSDEVLVSGGPAGGGLEDDILQPTEAGPKLGADSCVGGVPDTMQM